MPTNKERPIIITAGNLHGSLAAAVTMIQDYERAAQALSIQGPTAVAEPKAQEEEKQPPVRTPDILWD